MRQLISELRKNNIQLKLVEGELSVKFPKGEKIDDAIVSTIKSKKKEIIEYLQTFNKKSNFNIPLVEERSSYPLSSSQRTLWVLSQFKEGNVANNMPSVYVFEGKLDRAALGYSFAALIERHEILRTVFKEDENGEVKQFINPAAASQFELVYTDLRREQDQEEKVNELIVSEFSSSFDLVAGPLLRATICQVSDSKWIFTYVMHHIISDGWSMDILIKEVLHYYNARVNGERISIAPLRIHYKDYACWQQSQLSGEQLAAHKTYWLDQMQGTLPVLELLGDKPRPFIKTYNGEMLYTTINSTLTSGLKSLSQEQGGTLFMGLLAAVNTLLYRYTNQEDIIIGSLIAGREHADLEDQIGYYVNTLALRMQFKGAGSYKELIQRAKQVTLGAYEHQVYPFDELVEALQLQRDLSRNPLFDVLIVLQNVVTNQSNETYNLGELQVNAYEGERKTYSEFDLVFTFSEVDSALEMSIGYNSDIYTRSTVERMAAHLNQLLEAILSHPDVAVSKLDYLTATEKQQLLETFNPASVAYPNDKSVVALFEEQAARTPDAIALVFENTNLTYKELDERSNRLAHHLRSTEGITTGDLVGVMLDRSEKTLIAILGILKAGAAYVPIDSDYPRARKEYIIQDTKITVLLTQSDYLFELDYFTGSIFAMDIQLDALTTPSTSPDIAIFAGDLAYIMYTSGSMGTPKGVMVEHRSIVRLVCSTNIVELHAEQVLLSTGAVSFDATTFEYWSMLLHGGRLIMSSKEALLSVDQLSKLITDHEVSMMWFTAGWLNQLVDTSIELFSGLKVVLAGGDKLSAVHIRALQDRYPSLVVINGYGPTENTTFSLTHHILPGFQFIPIGTPISNSTAYVLDDQQELVPIGVAGEIHVGGDGLARGYLNNDALTASKFIAHPFTDSKRMYKTGDLGRWHADGTIEFLGRKDAQVKIRGYRIELGEIESVLQTHAEISAAVVIAQATAGEEKELVVYYVSKSSPSVEELRSYVSNTLPAYMVPNYYLQLEELPLNSNGKVDKKRLPSAEGLGVSGEIEYIAPRNETEKKLAAIWEELLGKEKISVRSNFFEIGGHSLKAIRLSSQIHKVFDVKMELNDLFSRSVLEEQAKWIEESSKTSFITIPVLPAARSYPLSSSQRRLWVLSQFEEANVAYNMSDTYVFEGKLDRAALTYSFAALIERHEILRTVFKEDENGEVKQFINPAAASQFELVYKDLRREQDQETKINEFIQSEFTTPFDLAAGPLIHATVYQVTNNKWVFTYVMHHIISDGWSMDILIKEVLHYYNARVKGENSSIAPLRIHYKEYASWQQSQLSGENLTTHKTYWLDQLQGTLPVLELQGDKPRPFIKTYNGGILYTSINSTLTSGLKSLSQEQGGTLFMGLLATVNTLLYRYSNQEDIIIGSLIAGREHADLDDQIGFYVNTLALRMQFKGAENFKELVQRAKQVTLGAYEHQVYPFDELVDALQLQRDLSRNPLFDVLVVLQNASANNSIETYTLNELTVGAYQNDGIAGSKFDLSFDFVEIGEEIHAHIIYNSDIYTRSTVERMAAHLNQLLEAILSHPDVAISKLDYLSVNEKQQLLETFNPASVAYPNDKSVVTLFEEQAARTPDAIALVFEKTNLTYKELDERSNRLAHHLRSTEGITTGDLVGVMLDRSEKTLIAILGILKAGAAYVPIDSDYPRARKEYIIQDTKITVLLTQSDYLFELDYFTGSIFAMDIQLDALTTPSTSPDIAIFAGDLAYIMYTSGSMGTPKGVMVEHRSIVRLVCSTNIVELHAEQVLLSTGAVSFDATTFEYWSMLLHGGRLIMSSKEALLSVDQLSKLITDHEVSMMWFTAGWLNQLVDTSIELFSGLKVVLAGGDKLSAVHIRALQDRYPSLVVINGYGPTENTTFSLTHHILPGFQFIPIGTPISNSTAYVLDDQQELVPIGVAGEIHVGGDGLARGYLNNDALTASKFIAHPFTDSKRMYKTGDLGRWHADGTIEFLGRKDAQVKIRGYRIELGEIESVLQTHAEISAAVVIAQATAGEEKELVVYYVSKSSPSVEELRSYVSNTLPAYMVPNYYLQLEELPLNSNGKVDKKRLPSAEGLGVSGEIEYIAPRNETEKKLAAIWEELLGKEKISVRSNFFEIGGHSLKAIRLSSQIHKVFDVKMELNDLFSRSVLEEQAKWIEESSKTSFITIPVLPAARSYPLSSSQRRLWVLSQFEDSNIAYNMPGVYVFEGKLDRAALTYAFAALIERHEILRTVFKEDENGEVKQFIHPVAIASAGTSQFEIAYTDLRNVTEQETLLKQYVESYSIQPFDLAAGPLIHARVYQLADNKWVFAYVMHHIISDGWSMDILIKELLHFYNARVKGETVSIAALRIHYKEYASWQQSQLSGENLTAHKSYWLDQLQGTLPVLELQGDKPRPFLKTYNGGIVQNILNEKLTSELRSLSQEQGGTLFMGLLAAVNTLLYRYTNQEDIIIGSPIAGREHADLDDQIGFYVNTLALRMQFNGTESYRQLVQRSKQVTLGAYEHQVYPFDELVDALELQRDLSRNPLFDVVVVLQNASVATSNAYQLNELEVRAYESEIVTSKFDLLFTFAEMDGALQTSISYNSDIYDHSTVVRLSAHLEQLLQALVCAPDVAISKLDYLSGTEKQQLLETFNPTSVAYPNNKSIAALFEEQAARTPQAIALVFENTHLTYKELDERSNQLAHHLRSTEGITTGDLVGVMLDRSEKTLIAILGILKAGAAYVPIDSDYPRARKEYIIQDTKICVLLTQSDYLFDLDYFTGSIFVMDTRLDALSTPAGSLDLSISASDLAYIMYTSGSMGTPKGVMVEHLSIARLVCSTNIVELNADHILLSTGAVSFDATTFEYWSMLLHGGRLIMSSKEALLSVNQLSKLITAHQVSMMWFTAGWLNQLVDTSIELFSGLKVVLAGGDKLSAVHIQALQDRYPSLVVINGYGPTENTTFSLTHHILPGFQFIPIGTPINNSTAYVLDDQQELVPIGVAGEIYVGGDGLARGYLNNDDLTNSKFIAHPFTNSKRMYKTGDLGRWHADGTIEFLGRKDAQVKIRGYRIELGEIEHTLQSHASVDSCAVIASAAASGEYELVVYVVGKEAFTIQDLRSYLSKRLPAYMVPGYYVQLDALPLTSNGKIDKKRLPAAAGLSISSGIEYVAPRNETEEKLVAIWEELLGKEKISVKDNFFDIGGHSLKATRLASQIHKAFDVKIELKELFSKAIVEEQAAYILQAGKTSFIEIPVLEPASSYPLSSSQRRLWVLSQFEESNIAYNMPGVYVFEGKLDREALTHSFFTLLERHEILRTVFKEEENGDLKQFIYTVADSEFGIVYKDLRKENVAVKDIKELVRAETIKPFDLAAGPLLRATVYQLADNKWVVVYVMHHIISDGWSMEILMKELLQFYNASIEGIFNPLPALPIQYKEYASWQQSQLNNDVLNRHREYWLEQLQEPLPVLELPGDRARPLIKTYAGGIVTKQMHVELTKELNKFCQQQGGTLFMGLLAAVNTLLYRYTNQEDIIIGSPIAGRQHIYLEDQIGFYLNTLALRTQLKGEYSYKALFEKTKQLTLDAYEHQAYPFDELVSTLNVQRDMSRSALFDVMVVLQNAETGNLDGKSRINDLKVNVQDAEEQHVFSKFDLSFIFAEAEGKLHLAIEYNSDIYDRSTVARLSAHLEQLLQALVSAPDQAIGELDYLTAIEKQELLEVLNPQAVGYPKEKTIVSLFEEQVARTPDHIALVADNITLTYKELNERSNQLSNYLRAQYQVVPDDLVGIQLPRGEWMIISILAILKSGAAYVPIDTTYPQDRIDYMIRDSNCKVVIDEAELNKFNAADYDKMNTALVAAPHHLAYVIYTSGTTGNPKGSLIEHKNVVRLFKTDNPLFDFSSEDVWTMFHSYCFDFSVWEMYGALLYGGKLVMVTSEVAKDAGAYLELLKKEGVTILNQTPSSFYNVIKEELKTPTHDLVLRYVIFGGEALSPGKLIDFQKKYPGTHLINMYGITETTVHVTYKEIGEQEINANISNIGKAIPTLSCYVLDSHRQLLPIGALGELYVGGEGVARGYLNREALSKERFIADPFKAGNRLYRSGDKVRLLSNGELEYLGRIDDQVKIRGYRIELGEIEHALQSHSSVDSCVVIASAAASGEYELVVYVVGKEAFTIQDLRSYLSKRIPAYMVPGYYVQLDALPLTSNGKIDKKRLPAATGLGMASGIEYVAPRNETEEKLVQIWQELLGMEKIGVKDNFFEIGGHSLKATRLASQIHKAFDVNLSLMKLFHNPTIENIAEEIQKTNLVNDEQLIEMEDAENISL